MALLYSSKDVDEYCWSNLLNNIILGVAVGFFFKHFKFVVHFKNTCQLFFSFLSCKSKYGDKEFGQIGLIKMHYIIPEIQISN